MNLYSGAMKRLTLMRHAKSSWDKPDVHDFDRTLNERGGKAAPLMGVYMKENRLIPDYILCSSAVRTRQTLELILPYFDDATEVIFSDRLYLASPDAMLKLIK
ncbi:MAG: histidine phosphatase family protein, partial [Alphaproteobacteria bacterium]|nr:histidine phosphatase family protein [Alphaproteobacteria bacterium]